MAGNLCPNFATKGFTPGTTNVMAGGTSGVNAIFTCQDRPSQTCTISVIRSCGTNGVGYMYQVSANCAGQARLRLSYVDMDGKTHISKEAAFFDNVKQQTSCLVVTNWGTHTCSDGTIGPSVNAAGEQWYITMNGFSQTCDTEKKEMCKVTMETATGGTTTPEGGTTTTVECGKALSISATANNGYIFREWSKTSGDGTFGNQSNKSTTFTPKSDSTIKANFDKQGGDPTCTINLIGDGGFGGQVNAKVNLSGGASKSVTLSSSNSYKATWSGMACGEKYTVSATAELSSSANKEAWADAVLSATAEPDSFTLNEEQDVYIKITDSAVQDCGIEVQGTGDTGNGVFANISLSGGASETATLDESNNYLATWTGLTCGKSYTVSVTKAGEKKNGAVTTTKVTATVNPSGAFTITGQANDVTKYVTVDFKKDEGPGAIKVSIRYKNQIESGIATTANVTLSGNGTSSQTKTLAGEFGDYITFSDLKPGTYSLSFSGASAGSGYCKAGQPTPELSTTSPVVTAGKTTEVTLTYVCPDPGSSIIAYLDSGFVSGVIGAQANCNAGIPLQAFHKRAHLSQPVSQYVEIHVRITFRDGSGTPHYAYVGVPISKGSTSGSNAQTALNFDYCGLTLVGYEIYEVTHSDELGIIW